MWIERCLHFYQKLRYRLVEGQKRWGAKEIEMVGEGVGEIREENLRNIGRGIGVRDREKLRGVNLAGK